MTQVVVERMWWAIDLPPGMDWTSSSSSKLGEFKLVFSGVKTSLLSVNSEASSHLSKTSSTFEATSDISDSSETLKEQLMKPRWLALDGTMDPRMDASKSC